ncbi:MAG: cupin domain-containing protein [Vicinamibacterales bacterium]
MADAAHTPWPVVDSPSRQSIEAIFRESGLSPAGWSNAAGDRYSAHSHIYHEMLYCVSGSIRFDLPDTGASFDLRPGDRLEIAPGTTHSALVGPDGVACVEAARVSSSLRNGCRSLIPVPLIRVPHVIDW